MIIAAIDNLSNLILGKILTDQASSSFSNERNSLGAVNMHSGGISNDETLCVGPSDRLKNHLADPKLSKLLSGRS